MKSCINGVKFIRFLKSKNLVKFCVHMSPVCSCRATYTLIIKVYLGMACCLDARY